MKKPIPSDQDRANWSRWVSERPPHVREVAARFTPFEAYLHKPTNEHVMVVGFDEMKEGVRVRMLVSSKLNAFTLFDRQVFGVPPEDLEICAWPDIKDGIALFSPDEVEANLDTLRVMIRPDLWEMGEDGTARLKAGAC